MKPQQPRFKQQRGVVQRFFRSIRLERDFGDLRTVSGYTPTPQVRQLLSRFEEGLRQKSTERAWTLTGPYGSGKSAFALFLAHLLNGRKKNNIAWRILAEHDPRLAQQFDRTLNGKALFPIVLTLRRAPLGLSILQGLQVALKRLPESSTASALFRSIRSDLRRSHWDTQEILARVQALNDVARGGGRFCGILLIMDELGKALEYAARHPGEDIYLLQELGEVASRSSEQPFIIIGVLHQAFEQYGEQLNVAARKEWGKVQGRFSDVIFLEPPEQEMRLASQAAASLGLDGLQSVQSRLRGISEDLVRLGLAPSSLKPSEFNELSARAYPLHPLSLVALPHLFRRFAQNERSLFAYLLSQEPYGVQDVLRRSGRRLIRLPDLFDYFMANLAGSLAQKSFARRWLEVSDALERTPNLDEKEIAVLKSVGLLSILGEVSHLNAKWQLISLALADDPESEDIRSALESLRDRSLLVFRRYNGTYKIWEGSDVDIEARMDEARYKTANLPLAESLAKFLPRRPIVARRHSYQSGALRYFELRYFDEPPDSLGDFSSGRADAIVACCLPRSPQHLQAFQDWASTLNRDGESDSAIVVVIPQELGTLRETAAELAALTWVWENTPELRDDRVASRELAERTAQVEQALSHALDYLLDPRPEPLGSSAAWFHLGKRAEVHSSRGVALLLSDVMDRVYPNSPCIKNELVNRRSLSSAASAARRNLIERMLTRREEACLGIEGYPPERSIYESVLLNSGVHREVHGQWVICPPCASDPSGLLPLWTAMQGELFARTPEPWSVAQLFDRFSRPPYGILPGVMPIVFAAFLIANRDETSLYRDGVFIPDVNAGDFEVLMRRPELFSVAAVKVSGDREAVLQRMAKSLDVPPAVVPIARALLQKVKAIPESAWRTHLLSRDASNLRDAFDRARSPEKLLFYDIPTALGHPPLEGGESPGDSEVEQFFDKLNCALDTWISFAPALIDRARQHLLLSCGLDASEQGWTELRMTAAKLSNQPLKPQLVPFVKRLCVNGDQAATLDGVLALIAGKPPRAWADADYDRFQSEARFLGQQFLEARHLTLTLTQAERRLEEQVVLRLRTELGTGVPAHILRAAMSRLLQEL